MVESVAVRLRFVGTMSQTTSNIAKNFAYLSAKMIVLCAAATIQWVVPTQTRVSHVLEGGGRTA